MIDRHGDRATLTIDARGWSRSRALPGPYILEQLAHDTRDVIVEAGLDEYVLVGHSMGGKVAQLVVPDRPDILSRWPSGFIQPIGCAKLAL
jgi:pimeloyl-ACP methyl ester carboxylesterase